jgi:hypothetical protein
MYVQRFKTRQIANLTLFQMIFRKEAQNRFFMFTLLSQQNAPVVQHFSNVVNGLFRFLEKKGFDRVLTVILTVSMLVYVGFTNARALKMYI